MIGSKLFTAVFLRTQPGPPGCWGQEEGVPLAPTSGGSGNVKILIP